jgi:hypothetical protein
MNLFYKFSMFIFGVIFFTICLVTFWMTYPYKVITFNRNEFIITTPVVHQGGFVHYMNDYCKFMDLPAKVTRSFIDHIIFVTPVTAVNRPLGCHNFDIAVLIPTELPIGHYQMEMTYQYQVNPVRIITLKALTEEFEIVEATPSAK